MKHSARIMLLSIVAGAFFMSAFSGTGTIASCPSVSMVDKDSGTLTLILLRHAKSDKSNMNMPDIERPLEASGRLEAEEMGDYLVQNKIKIDKIFSSPSVRTKQTLEIICRKIGYGFAHVVWDSTLYACTGDHLITRVRDVGSTDYKTVMFVGHNPSITSAANALQTKDTISEVKTCGIVTIDFAAAHWSEVSKDNSILRFYAKPK